MSYATKRLLWIIACLVAIPSEWSVASSQQFLWWQLDSTWTIILTVLHVVFIFVSAGLAIYCNTKDAEQQ